MPAIYRPNNRAYMPMINRPTNRQTLYLTTIITAANTVLPPKQTFAASTCSATNIKKELLVLEYIDRNI